MPRSEKCLNHCSPLARMSTLGGEGRDMKNLELQHFTQPQLWDLKILISQLFDMVNFAQMNLMSVLKHLHVVHDEEHIIGSTILYIFHSPTRTNVSIEDVVVSSVGSGTFDKACPGIGKGISSIELNITSNLKRVAANHLN